MHAIYKSKSQEYYGKEMLNRARILELITLINKHIESDITPRKKTTVNPVIDHILTYINEHYADHLSLESLERLFYINKYALTKLFKQQTDMTIHNYTILKRITVAKQFMLEGTLPTKVYDLVGFKDYSTFYRSFERLEGITPKIFFNNCKKG